MLQSERCDKIGLWSKCAKCRFVVLSGIDEEAAYSYVRQLGVMLRVSEPPRGPCAIVHGAPNAKIMEFANSVFKAAYTAVLPHRLVSDALSVADGRTLTVTASGRRYALSKNLYVAAFGKAASGMARATEDILREHIVAGVVSVPHGTMEVFKKNRLWYSRSSNYERWPLIHLRHNQYTETLRLLKGLPLIIPRDMLPRDDTVFRYFEGAMHNLPDQNAYNAAVEVERMVERMTKEDVLLVLISGGGSALLPYPVPGITLAEKTQLIQFLSQRGADIGELNTVRQNLSQLKGGRLAELAAGKASRVISLIISDIIGDPLEFIASGPTCPRRTSPSDALAVIRKYSGVAEAAIPKSVLAYLATAKDEIPPSGTFDHVDTVIIGNNRTALEAGRAEAERLHYQTEIVDGSVSGEARSVGQNHARRLDQILSNRRSIRKRCWLWGGETTVRVKGSGIGGRNQEMVLAFASEAVRMKLVENYPSAKFVFLSAGTDGQDGPTKAAGAVIDSDRLKMLGADGVNKMEAHLERNDSYSFFQDFNHGQCHIKCGLTGTNVMDVQILLLETE